MPVKDFDPTQKGRSLAGKGCKANTGVPTMYKHYKFNSCLIIIFHGTIFIVKRIVHLAAIIILALVPNEVFAQCSSPNGQAGDIVYNSDYAMMQFCNGSKWIAMTGGGLDTLSGLSCASGQVAKWDGSNWICASDNSGIGGESDPKVGATTSGQWCRGTGSQVTCDQTPPSGGGGSFECNMVHAYNVSNSQQNMTVVANCAAGFAAMAGSSCYRTGNPANASGEGVFTSTGFSCTMWAPIGARVDAYARCCGIN